MKILFYCQHLLGVGHFFRGLEIVRALHRHSVLLALGGEPIPGVILPENVKVLSLPPLTPEFRYLNVRKVRLQIKKLRRQMLLNAFGSFKPDLIMTELFPFGRRRFRFEVVPLLKAAKRLRSPGPPFAEDGKQAPDDGSIYKKGESGPVKIVCSLRDILVEKKRWRNYESEVVALLNMYYDLLLVHSDPGIINLRETFGRCGDIEVPVEYSGFVSRPSADGNGSNGKKVIVASSGGGRVGVDLLYAVIEAVRKMGRSDLELRVFLGPFLAKPDRKHLADMASTDPRVRLRAFSFDFVSELSSADLSISLAGYNTCMDILSARVPALVYPFAENREQGMRAARLEKFGVMKVLPTLKAESLQIEIESILANHEAPPTPEIDIAGAANSARLIEKLCERY